MRVLDGNEGLLKLGRRSAGSMRLNAVLMVALIASMSGSIAYASNSTQPDLSKMSGELLSELESEDEIEVIIQFTSHQDDSVWRSLETMGIKMISEMSVLHGGLILGKSTDIFRLSTFSIVEHMELNVPIEHFYLPGDQNDTESMMHETVGWVNASQAWHRAIIGTDGVLKTEPDLSLKEYDGEGATAVDLDTGIDGEHPDFDCGEPWTGEKLIWSAKWTGFTWIDAPNCNSDTSSGHGTHVGGTIAGNGDASGGRRLGTAKGATIVALGLSLIHI